MRLRPSAGSRSHVERQLLGSRPRAGRARDRVEQVGEEDFLGFDRDRAGLDFGQVENVADQVEQVGAGAVDGAGEFDLLAGEVAVGVVAELLAENQDPVQRRPQLVRHVGQEFGLVFRGERELGRLFFERAARLLDFLVLAFDFDVLFGELLRLLLELLVGLLQLASAASAARRRAAGTASAGLRSASWLRCC